MRDFPVWRQGQPTLALLTWRDHLSLCTTPMLVYLGVLRVEVNSPEEGQWKLQPPLATRIHVWFRSIFMVRSWGTDECLESQAKHGLWIGFLVRWGFSCLLELGRNWLKGKEREKDREQCLGSKETLERSDPGLFFFFVNISSERALLRSWSTLLSGALGYSFPPSWDSF